MPPILSIGATYTYLNGERFATLERCAPCLIVLFGIVEMKVRKSLDTDARRLFQRKAMYSCQVRLTKLRIPSGR